MNTTTRVTLRSLSKAEKAVLRERDREVAKRADDEAKSRLGELLDEQQEAERAAWLRQQPAAARAARGVEGVEDLTESGWAMAQRYWLPAFKNERGCATPYGWVLGIGEESKPRQMANPTMEWRRPTYAEALNRERAWAKDPVEFLDREQWASENRRQR